MLFIFQNQMDKTTNIKVHFIDLFSADFKYFMNVEVNEYLEDFTKLNIYKDGNIFTKYDKFKNFFSYKSKNKLQSKNKYKQNLPYFSWKSKKVLYKPDTTYTVKLLL